MLVDAAPAGTRLGITGDTGRGFRAGRDVLAPREPFLLHAREVTWRELLAAGARDPELALPAPPDELRARADWAEHPATGVAWPTAARYCRALGGTLPSEEQWEWAARGRELRPHPWGDKRVDLAQTAAFRGERGLPSPVGASPQDRTPAGAGGSIYDLAGNAQEWTADLWREDAPGEDEGWVQSDGVTYRAVRGLPLAGAPTDPVPVASAAYREPLCATGPCPADTERLRRTIGFRCARPWP